MLNIVFSVYRNFLPVCKEINVVKVYLFGPVGPINDEEKNTRLYDCSCHHSIPNPLKINNDNITKKFKYLANLIVTHVCHDDFLLPSQLVNVNKEPVPQKKKKVNKERRQQLFFLLINYQLSQNFKLI